MNDFDALLVRVLDQARALKIPVSAQIRPHVTVNRRAVTRFGCCIRRGEAFEIELSQRLLEAAEGACLQTLAHEALHTCPGCRDHGQRWKAYAARMNAAYGYAIARTGTCQALGVPDVRPERSSAGRARPWCGRHAPPEPPGSRPPPSVRQWKKCG